MWYDESYKKHSKNVQKETENPAILNDIIESGLEQSYSNKDRAMGGPLHPLQEVVRNNTDGKTWQNWDK